jgi:isochorismate synthase EntC
MTHLEKSWWEAFFREGAFLRTSEGQLLLWKGPWSAGKETSKESSYSIGTQYFFESQTQLIQAHEAQSLTVANARQDLQQYLETRNFPEVLKYSDFQMPLKEEFEKTFQIIQGKIQRGEIEKAVPTITARANKKPHEGDVARMMYHLLEMPQSLWAYGFWNENEGIIGATPEILFDLKDGTLRTMALAGTCPKNQTEARMPLESN